MGEEEVHNGNETIIEVSSLFKFELQVALKPKNLNHTEATSIPYVAMTTWKALVDQAGLNRNTTAGKRSVNMTHQS